MGMRKRLLRGKKYGTQESRKRKCQKRFFRLRFFARCFFLLS
jgi:hypothetical protein